MARSTIRTVQRVATPEPMAHLDTAGQGAPEEDAFGAPVEGDDDETATHHEVHLLKAMTYAEHGGDISDMLDAGKLTSIGVAAVREWRMDDGERDAWLDDAKKFLAQAAQERDDDEERDPIWENASDIDYPILTTASGQFLARAAPELIKGDKVVGVKVFAPPAQKPDPLEAAKAGPQPQTPAEAQAAQAQIQAAQKQQLQAAQVQELRSARAERIKHYLNFLIFYRMDGWEDDADLLLLQTSIIGKGFKSVFMGPGGLKSEFLSSTCLTLPKDAKNVRSASRITQQFPLTPNEIEEKIRAGAFRDISLPRVSEDPEQPRDFIEQNRLEDLDGDGLAEPYIVTVDVETQQVMSLCPAYTSDDIHVDSQTGKIRRIERWVQYAEFTFLPDPKGSPYGKGLGSLLDAISDAVDTSFNQLIDAGTAQIAGGGFIGAGVRLQGSGQGGSIFFRPGEYLTAGTPGQNLREAIWERTVPNPSPVTMQMLEMLLAAAKDIASIKDVITGDAPSTAPVGTTLALQNQALQVFSSIYKRIYRGFRDEFRLMYQCLKRWATAKERQEYAELTGGDFDQDFQGDGTDIQPVADPTVVSKMQKISKMQTLLQFAESPVGQAAGMTQAGPAQEIAKDFLDVLDYDRPERFLAQVAPNPELVAKTNDMNAAAQLKQADAQHRAAETRKLGFETQKLGVDAAKTAADVQHTEAKTSREHAETLNTLAENSLQHHAAHVIADQIQQTGSLQPPAPEPEGNNGQ